MFRRRNEMSFFCRMLSLLYTLTFGGFSSQHIFHQFRQQTFFSAHIFNKFFFLTSVATNYLFHFFLDHPPPFQVSNGASLTVDCRHSPTKIWPENRKSCDSIYAKRCRKLPSDIQMLCQRR